MSDTAARLREALADRYAVTRELGRGGMATVYAAHDLKHDRDVAIKVLHPELGAALGAERFLKEISTTAKLHHPHILPLHDSGHAGDLLYYVMPFVEGETLRARLEREHQLPIADAIRIAREVASALDYAHRNGVIHRDIKPENILLQDGNALVADFGIALAVKEAGGERMTLTGFSLGTPLYMAPEQATGERALDARTDIYALGVVFFEMLAGEPPLKAPSGPAIIARRLAERAPSLRKSGRVVPPQVENVVASALERLPADRFATAADFARALEGDATIPRWRRLRRSPGAAVVGLGIVIALGAVAAWSISSSRGSVRTDKAKHSPRGTRDSVARDRVVAAAGQLGRRSEQNLERSVALYKEAIARDSNYAEAWAGLARALSFSMIWQFPLAKVGIPADSVVPQMVAASERAIEADSGSVNAWLARAATLRIVDPTSRRGMVNTIRRALSIDSTSAEAWFQLGGALADSLELEASIAAYRQAVAIDPRHVNALAFLGFDYNWIDKNDSALVWVDSAVAVDASSMTARQAAGVVRRARKDTAETLAMFESIVRRSTGPESIHGWAGLAELAWQRGDRRGADTLVMHAVAMADTLHPALHDAAYIAWAFVGTGQRERALRLLERFEPRFDEHFQLHLQGDRMLDGLRSDPRFIALLRRGPVLAKRR